MSEFLGHYLAAGLRDIVSIDYDSHEEQSGFQEENIRETIVARKGAGFIKVSMHLRKTYGPNGRGPEFNVSSEETITEQDYDQLRKGAEILDTPVALQQIADEDARQKQNRSQIEDLDQKIAATAPKCPKCGGGMKKKHGKYGYFWSCSEFPNCDGSAKFSALAATLQGELGKLYLS